MFDQVFVNRVKGIKTSKAMYQLLLECGYEVTEKEAAEFFCEIHQEGDLAKEELANVGQGQRY